MHPHHLWPLPGLFLIPTETSTSEHANSAYSTSPTRTLVATRSLASTRTERAVAEFPDIPSAANPNPRSFGYDDGTLFKLLLHTTGFRALRSRDKLNIFFNSSKICQIRSCQLIGFTKVLLLRHVMTADTKYRPLVLPLPRSDINLHLDGTFESLRIIDLQTFPTVEDEYELGDIIVVGLKALKEYFGPNSPLSHPSTTEELPVTTENQIIGEASHRETEG
ncbi:hypothetical protein B0H10DRAFT_1963480 [Mycena sp. CBHHK59/15]|nr:hypothetical protein B0H10DRAFT_1963480 [Mycena sp. CBHHK59/15]